MLECLKKAIVMGMLVVLPATMVVPGMAMAKPKDKIKENGQSQKGKKHHEFKDLDNHWAQKDVSKLTEEEIITGYADGTFQPEKEVTTLEAVVMAVRALGLTNEANSHMRESLPFKDAAAIPAWARGYVAIALEKGLIDRENVFQPNKPATRLDATILLVRALHGQEGLDTIDAQLRFVDTMDLDSEYKEYISQAIMHNLITGYDDKTFRPNKHVTRAEIVTLFARLLEDNSVGQSNTRVTGVLTEVDLNNSTIHVKCTQSGSDYGTTREYKVLSTAVIYRNDDQVDLEDLELRDNVEIVLNQDSQVTFIDANATEDTGNYLEKLLDGRITSIDTHDQTITVRVNSTTRELTVLSSAFIYRNDSKVDLEDLQGNDYVDLVLNEHNQVIFIDADTSEHDNDFLEGSLTGIDTHDQTITVKVNGVSREYFVLASAIIYRNDSKVDLEDLLVNDDVQIIVNEHSQVMFIDADSTEDVHLERVLRGRLISVDSDDKTITVNLSNIMEVKFPLANDVDITRDGHGVRLSGLEANDSLVLTQNANGLITKITATDD